VPYSDGLGYEFPLTKNERTWWWKHGSILWPSLL